MLETNGDFFHVQTEFRHPKSRDITVDEEWIDAYTICRVGARGEDHCRLEATNGKFAIVKASITDVLETIASIREGGQSA